MKMLFARALTVAAVIGVGAYSKLIAQYHALTQQACDDTVQHLEKQFASNP